MRTPEERGAFLASIKAQFEMFEHWEDVDPEPNESPEDEIEDLSLTDVNTVYVQTYTKIKKPMRPIGDI